MDVSPLALADTARSWDEQHLDVQAAAGQVGSAPTVGFTGAVAGDADRFISTWRRHLDDLGNDSEAQADGLRATATDMVRTDTGVASSHSFLLDAMLREVR